MDINVTFRRMEADDVLRDYVKEKIIRLKKYANKVIEVNVILSIEKHRNITEIILSADKTRLTSKEETDDMYRSIDSAVDKVERQLKKYREKLTDHKSHTNELTWRNEEISSQSLKDEKVPQVIKTDKFFVKPMTLEEATMQMDLSDNNFLVFIEAKSEKVEVIYRRNDGNYGLIELIQKEGI
ncbi:MAG: ribosome-associated translation inhibitor RaiA [Thermodesulfobacteriota bacterium]|nr:ribosome-associated translation inhibitor RaiA [Thermodesulfobacteriota bacterium]